MIDVQRRIREEGESQEKEPACHGEGLPLSPAEKKNLVSMMMLQKINRGNRSRRIIDQLGLVVRQGEEGRIFIYTQHTNQEENIGHHGNIWRINWKKGPSCPPSDGEARRRGEGLHLYAILPC